MPRPSSPIDPEEEGSSPTPVTPNEITWGKLSDEKQEDVIKEVKEEIKSEMIDSLPIERIVKEAVKEELGENPALRSVRPIYKGIMAAGATVSALGLIISILLSTFLLLPVFTLGTAFFVYIYMGVRESDP